MSSSTSFCSQANALLRKNLIIQKRDTCPTFWLFLFPMLLLLVSSLIQTSVNNILDQGDSHPIPHPEEWPALLHIPAMPYRAVETTSSPFMGLAHGSCRSGGLCPVTLLLTGNNKSLGLSVAEKMFPGSFSSNSSQVLYSLANMVLASEIGPPYFDFLDPAFFTNIPIYGVQLDQCSTNSTFLIPLHEVQREIKCVRGLYLWRNSSSEVNDELFKGYHQGNLERKINEFVAAYDFLNSDKTNFNVTIWYNSTRSAANVARSVNLVSNAYLRSLKGDGTMLLLDFLKGMPEASSNPPRQEISSAFGVLLFYWATMQLFNVVVTSLVKEKELKLRMMMKMHGLNDKTYWLISYAYFLVLSMIYMLCLVVFASVLGLGFFTLNDFRIQLLFYFIYINLQISLAFLLASFFSNVNIATVLAFVFLFGSRLLGKSLFEFFVEDTTLPRDWITIMELYPGFSLYRGIYEFAQYALIGSVIGTQGMQWKDLSDTKNGMKNILIVMFVQWLILLFVAYYRDQLVSPRNSFKRRIMLFLQSIWKNPLSLPRNGVKKRILLSMLNISKNSHLKREESSTISTQMEKLDVSKEREKVDKWLLEPGSIHAVICDNLRKVYPGKLEKIVVRGLSLAISKGECFGILGTTGAGKTSFISMMTGLMKPTSGKVFIEGLDTKSDTKEIYTRMGYCPQHDLLWETLTGREHLLFYGRLRSLKGSALTQAVGNSLERVKLVYRGVSDKKVAKYSADEKRRLSIAISLLGDPKVVYMDEPTVGLDSVSRAHLWNVLKHAKQDRTIILATNSAEEAEALCDRIGILVDGSLLCIGSPKELKARYGGTSIFSITTSPHHEQEVEELVLRFSPNAHKIYQKSGTQKFELPKQEARIAAVTQAILNAKSKFAIHAWALTHTSLEDILTKVATDDGGSSCGGGEPVSAGSSPFVVPPAAPTPADPSGGNMMHSDDISMTNVATSSGLRLIETRLQSLELRFTVMESWIAAQPGPSSHPFPTRIATHGRGSGCGGGEPVSASSSPSIDPPVAPTPADLSVEEMTRSDDFLMTNEPISSDPRSIETRLQSLESRFAAMESWIAARPGPSSHQFPTPDMDL